MIALLAAGAIAMAASTAPAATPGPRVLFSFSDDRIVEASGIARGVVSPGVFYVHNDSGDTNRFFAVDARTGALRAQYRVRGASAVDWEDIGVAPDAAGRSSVWIADTGDNGADRADVSVYRTDEPRVSRGSRQPAWGSVDAQVWRLRYPSGPADAESLFVTPAGRAYLVTKTATGHSTVYAVPPMAHGEAVQTVRQVATITFRPQLGSLIPWKEQVLATGAAMSPDGSLLVVRTYTQAYLYRVHAGDVRAALRSRPVVLTLPLQLQGEGVCFDGNALVLDSEGPLAPVLRVPLPAALDPRRPAPDPPPSSSPRNTAPTTAPTTAPATASPTPASPSVPSARATPAAADGRARDGVGLAIAALLTLGVVWLAVAFRRRRG